MTKRLWGTRLAVCLLGGLLAAASSGCGLALLDLLDGGLPGSPGNPLGGSSRPAGTALSDAAPLTLDANGNAAFDGAISGGEANVFDLGALNPGDRVILSVNPASGSSLDPVAAVFTSAGEMLALNDDVDLNAGLLGSRIDEIVSTADEHYYLAVAKFYYDARGGAYTGAVRVERGGTFPRPPVQYLLLNFGGGTVTLPGEGTINVGGFDAADVDAAYSGMTAQIKAKVVETVRQDFRDTGLEIITSDDPLPPGPCIYSTIYFGAYSATKFGLSESVDQSNRDRCDDAIVFTDDFDKPFAVQPTPDGLGVAIGNVAAHEAGHLLGLQHVADITDLMDNTGTASTLLADQEFKTAPLSPSVFPLGSQNGPLLLDRVVPK